MSEKSDFEHFVICAETVEEEFPEVGTVSTCPS